MVSPSYHAAMGTMQYFSKLQPSQASYLVTASNVCADLSFGAEAHAEAATALAELYVALGQPKAALEILYSLQGVGAVLSPASPSIWPLHWRRASLFMKLGHMVSCLPMCDPGCCQLIFSSSSCTMGRAHEHTVTRSSPCSPGWTSAEAHENRQDVLVSEQRWNLRTFGICMRPLRFAGAFPGPDAAGAEPHAARLGGCDIRRSVRKAHAICTAAPCAHGREVCTHPRAWGCVQGQHQSGSCLLGLLRLWHIPCAFGFARDFWRKGWDTSSVQMQWHVSRAGCMQHQHAPGCQQALQRQACRRAGQDLKGGCTNVQGFVTRDRRKDYARESDQRLAELEQTYAEALQEGAHLM